MNRTLWKLLHEHNWTDVKERTVLENLKQMTFYFVPPRTNLVQSKKNDDDERVTDLSYSEHIAKIVLLSSTGEVLKDHLLKLCGGDSSNIVKEEL